MNYLLLSCEMRRDLISLSDKFWKFKVSNKINVHNLHKFTYDTFSMSLKYTLYNRTLECYLKLRELEKKNAIKRKILRNIFNLGTTCRVAFPLPRSCIRTAWRWFWIWMPYNWMFHPLGGNTCKIMGFMIWLGWELLHFQSRYYLQSGVSSS